MPRLSLFPGKRRGRTISITVTDAHYRRMAAATARLGLTRSDLLGLLIELYVDTVKVPAGLVPDVGDDRD